MSADFKINIYFIRISLERENVGKEGIEAVSVIGDGEGG